MFNLLSDGGRWAVVAVVETSHRNAHMWQFGRAAAPTHPRLSTKKNEEVTMIVGWEGAKMRMRVVRMEHER